MQSTKRQRVEEISNQKIPVIVIDDSDDEMDVFPVCETPAPKKRRCGERQLSHRMECFRADLNHLSFSDPRFSDSWPVKVNDSQEKMNMVMMARELAIKIGRDASFPRLNHIRDIGALPILWSEGLNFSITACLFHLRDNKLQVTKPVYDTLMECSGHWKLSSELKSNYGVHPDFEDSCFSGVVDPMNFAKLGHLAYFLLETDRAYFDAKIELLSRDSVRVANNQTLSNLDFSRIYIPRSLSDLVV